MRIVFTGGGSGGHFYPILSMVSALKKKLAEEKIVNTELYFFAPSPYNKGILFDFDVKYKRIISGKRRIYFSLLNIVDLFKLVAGVVQATWNLLLVYPDVVVGKGGYASFPTIMAARILRIPVLIHESDTVPGRVNKWAGKFAKRVAVSYAEAVDYFPNAKVAHTGNPLRDEIVSEPKASAEKMFNLEPQTPLVLILGGSQGAQIINDTVVEALPQILRRFQVVHQTGRANLEDVQQMSAITLKESKSETANRYHPKAFLSIEELVSAGRRAEIVVSRAGSTIFEIAVWGVPSIIIPITESNGDHQRRNAYAYARSGGAVVIEEKNLSKNILSSELERIMDNAEMKKKMSASAQTFARTDAADKIAEEIVHILLAHLKKS